MKNARMLVAVYIHAGNLINKKTSMSSALLMIGLRRVKYLPVFFASFFMFIEYSSKSSVIKAYKFLKGGKRKMKGKSQKGITLVALIITIIILLILAAVAIRVVQGNDTVDHAQKAVEKYNEKKSGENTILQSYMDYLNKYSYGNSGSSNSLNVTQSYNQNNDEVILKITPVMSDEKVIQLVFKISGDANIDTIEEVTKEVIELLVKTSYDEFVEENKSEIGDMNLAEQFAYVMQIAGIKEAYGIETINEFAVFYYLTEYETTIQLKIDGNDVSNGIGGTYPFEYTVTKNGQYDIQVIIDDESYTGNVTVSDIDGNIIRIGETIEYSAGGVEDWKVFYKNNQYVYIITSDYLRNDLLPAGANFRTSGDYGVSFSSTTSTGAADITRNAAGKFMLSWWNENRTSTARSVRAVADLLNTQIWTPSFGDAARGIEAIGSPTYEMLAASLKIKIGLDISTTYSDNGYTSIESIKLLGSVNGDDAYELYFISSDNSEKRYWLASHATGEAIGVVIKNEHANGIWSQDSDISEAIRPVVAVPINLVERNSSQGLMVK